MTEDPLEPGKEDVSRGDLDVQRTKLSQSARSRKLIWILSLGGLIPFAGLALALLVFGETNPLQPIVVDALKTYAAIILSFLGGIRWGLAMKAQDMAKSRVVFTISVLPSIIGWFALFLPVPYVFAVLLLAFAAVGAWDSFAGQMGVFGSWFVRLRMWLTFAVSLSLGIAFFATV